jgi:hypothetical protein
MPEVGDHRDPVALATAQIAVASREAPQLRRRADRLLWPRGDLADRTAAALEQVAAADPQTGAGDAIHEFVRLDNEFRTEYCTRRTTR